MTSSGADQRLDAAIAQWAASVRLSPASAATMLDAIMETPVAFEPEPSRLRLAPPLSGQWWRAHTANLAATFVSSSRGLAIAA